jgi:hypothetical protein
MSRELPNPGDIEIVQMMAAQKVVMDNHNRLYKDYLKQIREYCEEYGVEVPSKVERELQEEV